ncbi:unnamed protein product [Notodromas monacha]|uniref:MSP domain-containing protein n=1 Tax=Notodromas monacha TaxID=399045 RepID=A0A7R9BC06_9CRUS|nr:unnamed protein product [Notodromas monacha]CAG0912506.1 unnamed protein product [Notodromas monacha]
MGFQETHHDSQEPRWLVAWPPNELEFVLDSKHENLLKAAMFLVNLSPDIQVRVKVKAPARAAEMVAASPSTCLLLPRQSKKITFFARDYDESCCKIKVIQLSFLLSTYNSSNCWQLEAERLMMDATSNLKEQHNYWVDENVQEKLIQELKSIISGNAVCSQSAPLEKVSTPVSGRLIELHSDGPGCSSSTSTETSFKSLPDSGEAHKYTILGSSLLCNSGRSQQLGFKVEEHPEYVPCEAQCVDEDVASAPKPSVFCASIEDAAMGNKFKELPPLQTFKSSVGIIKIGLMDSKNSSQPSLTQASSLKCSEIIHPKTPVPFSTHCKVPVKKTPKKPTTINQLAKMYLRKHGVSDPLRQDMGDCKMEPVAERNKFSCSVNPFFKTLTGGVSILAKSLIGLCFAGVLICVLEELMESLH